MGTLLVVFGVMLLIVAGMAVGVLLGRKPISGSCGGMSAIGMESACDVCGGDKSRCDKESTADQVESIKDDAKPDFYDASR